MRCSVYGCNADNQSKYFTDDIKFFSFPKDKKMQIVWKRLCGRGDDFNIRNARICSRHFNEDNYIRNLRHELLGYVPKTYRPLKNDAIPSISLPKDQENMLEFSKEQNLQKKIAKDLSTQ